MRVATGFSALASFVFLVAWAPAQCTNLADGCDQAVPRLIKFSGALQGADGNPRTGTVGVLFSLYRESTGGTPLWQETQNITLDEQGHYDVVLGVTKADGIPLDIFWGGESRWLGVQPIMPGEVEQPRVLLVSVPYALKAADAETLGGFPASAFLRTGPAAAGVEASPGYVANANVAAQASNASQVTGRASGAPNDQTVTTSGGTANALPHFSTPTSIVNSQITDSNGMVSMHNLANTLFADQFAGGVPDAIAACPAAGCTIYAASPGVNLNLGTIDPVGKAITLYLGPFTYNVTQITLRGGLRIIGMGGSWNGTILQSVNGENPVFVIPQADNSPAANVLLSGFRVLGSANNKAEDAFFFDASTLHNAGLWFSSFDDVYIAGFSGIGIHLKGPNSNFGAGNQFLLFNNVVVYRTLGGGNGIRIEGANFELHFTDCFVHGQAVTNGTNIYIGGLPGNTFSFPFVITFRGLVSQAAALAVQLDGAQSVSFYSSHHEALSGGYLITNSTKIGTRGVTIADSSFFSNVGVDNGTGFLLDVNTPSAWGIRFVHNQIYGTPDSVVRGTSEVIYQDNSFGGSSSVPPTSGITARLNPASIINIGSAHSVGLNTSTTPIATIQGSLGPGEMVTLFTIAGAVVLAAGGNINLMGANTLTVNGSITLVRTDLSGSPQWVPVSQWAASSQGGGSSFTFSTDSSPPTASVAAGETATFNLSLTSAGFSGTIHLVCTGAPAASTCTVSPNPLGLIANGTARAMASVATTAQTVAQVAIDKQTSRATRATPGSCLLLAWPAFWIIPQASGMSGLSKKRWVVLMGLFLLLLFALGCGTARDVTVAGTPAGTYNLIVTASSGSFSRSQMLTLTVQ